MRVNIVCDYCGCTDKRTYYMIALTDISDRSNSCLKCLVMRDLIKDCPEKSSAVEIVKEYDKWTK